jgi:hypothetical protein
MNEMKNNLYKKKETGWFVLASSYLVECRLDSFAETHTRWTCSYFRLDSETGRYICTQIIGAAVNVSYIRTRKRLNYLVAIARWRSHNIHFHHHLSSRYHRSPTPVHCYHYGYATCRAVTYQYF